MSGSTHNIQLGERLTLVLEKRRLPPDEWGWELWLRPIPSGFVGMPNPRVKIGEGNTRADTFAAALGMARGGVLLFLNSLERDADTALGGFVTTLA